MKAILHLALSLFIGLYSDIVVAQNTHLDTSFGVNGKIVTDLGQANSQQIEAVAIQPDGKIVVSNYRRHQDISSWSIVIGEIQLKRYNSNGTLDNTFGIDGEVNIAFGQVSGTLNDQMALVIQPDGKIKCSGFSYSNHINVVVRVNPDGTPDNDFGINGVVTNNALEKSIVAFFPSSDKYVIASTEYDGLAYDLSTRGDFGVKVYNANGTPDTSFGTNGHAKLSIGFTTNTAYPLIPNFNSADYVTCVRVQPDGKILVGGNTDANVTYSSPGGGSWNADNFVLVRFNSDGTLDTTFGFNGIAMTDFNSNDVPTSVMLTNENKILMVGSNPNTCLLAKYNSDGTPDATFGTSGKVWGPVGGETLKTIIELADGKLLAGGRTYYSNTQPIYYLLRRFEANGTIDTSFGVNGKIEDMFGPVSSGIICLAAKEDTVIVAGFKYSPYLYPALAKYVSGALAVTDFNSDKTFQAYPNPVTDNVNIFFNLLESGKLVFELFDASGRKIASLFNGQFISGQQSQKLELPQTLTKGIYFIAISNERVSTTVKIVK